VSISSKGTLLWATSYSHNSSLPGYLSAFRINELGYVSDKLLQVPTPTSGGKSNNVAACPFQENLVALAEAENGTISIWRYVPGPAQQSSHGGNATSTLSAPSGIFTGNSVGGGLGGMGGGYGNGPAGGAGTVKMVASVKIGDGESCCSEAVWLD
jgi:hypothetical protein